MLIDYAHIFIFFTYHGFDTSLFGRLTWFYFQLDIFIIERWKAGFHIHTIIEMFAFITQSFFLLSLGWKWIRGILL